MSAALTAGPAPVLSLGDLHDAVQERIRAAHPLSCAPLYETLRQRFERVRHGAGGAAAKAALDTDLRALLAASDAVLQRMVGGQATSVACRPYDGVFADQQAVQQAALARHNELLRPRESVGELVRRFGARGVLVRAVDGQLHVTPATALTAADREVLLEHKVSLLEALAQAAVI